MGNIAYIFFFVFLVLIVFSFCSVIYYIDRVSDRIEQMISELTEIKSKQEKKD
jgi:hypothetical protein